MPVSPPAAKTVAVLAFFVTSLAVLSARPASVEQRRDRQPLDLALLEQWISAIEQHVPGDLDLALAGATSWTGDDLRRLWANAQVLLTFLVRPTETTFLTPPLDEAAPDPAETWRTTLRRGRQTPVIVLRADDRQAMTALARRASAIQTNPLLKRAAMLHTDVATLTAASPSGLPGPPSARAPVKLVVGDGRDRNSESVSLHWDVARLLLARVTPNPGRDTFVRDWYRATIALAQSTAWFNSAQLDHGLRLLPEDSMLQFFAGCQHEMFASPLIQEFARSTRTAAVRPDIGSASVELDAAERAFRLALAADPGLVEARLRLAHVLTLHARPGDARRELRQVVARPLEPLLGYYAALLLGLSQEAEHDFEPARRSFEQAATIVPDSRVPYLALARLAHARGDRTGVIANLDHAAASAADDDLADPWWMYDRAQGRHALRWMQALRQKATADEP